MFLRKGLFVISGIILACGIVTFAQEPQPQMPAVRDEAFQKERLERRERQRERLGRQEGIRGHDLVRRRGAGMGHLMRELNLTEEQRQQSHAIVQRRLESIKAQREELFKLREKRIAGTFTADDEARAKNLRQEIRTTMAGVSTEMAGVLTVEQKGKLEQLKQERKEKFEQRMKERQKRLNQNPE
ncbi:MAG TPA: Spy/CpxP family protein refolding chaperone [Pyrinomonadaceae bacterium]|jgi:Spy/CpxP family protein refolding chaperone